jgi:hypothetical protein
MACVMAAFGLNPAAVVCNPGGVILAIPIREKQRGTVRRLHPEGLVDQALSHSEGAIPNLDG